MQFGFEFDDAPAAYAIAPVGTWLEPKMTTSQYAEAYASAQERVHSIVGAARPLFSRGIDTSMEGHQAQIERMGDVLKEPYRLNYSTFDFTEDEIEAFVGHCRSMSGADFPSIQYKIWKARKVTVFGMYVKGLGSLTASVWNDGCHRMFYYPYKDTFFLESYSDNIESIYCPAQIWNAAYACQQIAEAGEGVASVKTFSIKGREFVNDGALWAGKYSECKAYSLCALKDWHGQTFNYRSMINAFDDGSVQRGDCRGLIVKVRGQLCVLERQYCVYDDNTNTEATLQTFANDEEDEDDENPYEDIEWQDEEEVEMEA